MDMCRTQKYIFGFNVRKLCNDRFAQCDNRIFSDRQVIYRIHEIQLATPLNCNTGGEEVADQALADTSASCAAADHGDRVIGCNIDLAKADLQLGGGLLFLHGAAAASAKREDHGRSQD